MIAALRAWLTAIVTVTLLLSVAQTLIPEGSLRKVASFTGGLILLIVMLRPVLGADLERLDLDLDAYAAAIQERQADLEAVQQAELAAGIAARTEAYIKDKAASLGLAVDVRVKTAENAEGVPLPAAVDIAGPPSEELAAYMERELGISRERQVWHERGSED